MEKTISYRMAIFAVTTIASAFLYTDALAATTEYIAEYCTDHSVERLIREDSVDEMDLRDQYDLIDKYFAACMTKQKAEMRKEATYVNQPVFFN